MLLNGKGKLIYYDDENMKCYEVTICDIFTNIGSVDCVMDVTQCQTIKGKINVPFTQFQLGRSIIELDPTTMQRIAKYNKEREIDLLNKKIEKKEKELKYLTERQTLLSRKLDSLQDFMQDFMSDENEIDPYDFANKDCYDYDD